MSGDRMVRAARAVIETASTPVEVDGCSYVLVPINPLKRLEQAISPEDDARRLSDDNSIMLAPNMRFGGPCIGHSRLDPEQMAERLWSGLDVEFEIMDGYGLTRAQVVLCCWYVASYGSRTWRKRWGQWLRDTWGMTRCVPDEPFTGWWGDWGAIELPPSKDAVQS